MQCEPSNPRARHRARPASSTRRSARTWYVHASARYAHPERRRTLAARARAPFAHRRSSSGMSSASISRSASANAVAAAAAARPSPWRPSPPPTAATSARRRPPRAGCAQRRRPARRTSSSCSRATECLDEIAVHLHHDPAANLERDGNRLAQPRLRLGPAGRRPSAKSASPRTRFCTWK